MKRLLTVLLVFIHCFGYSQTKQDYIYNYAHVAVKEMEISRIPASITLAQGILESRYGTSELSSKSNNHFGIKCHRGWQGQSVKYDDDAKDECFRKYGSAIDSFRDHSEFLSKRGRYSDLFKLSIYDYKGWAKGLKKAGYATNPRYADHLIKIIEEEKLYVFDRMTSYEVGPYIASLRNQMKPNQVFAIETEQKTTNDPIVSSPTVKAVVEVQGGPAAAPEQAVAQSRDIFIENKIKTVFSFTDDSPSRLAVMYDIPLKRLYKYNEWPQYLNEFSGGMKVYLQPKKNKSKDITQLYHRVAPGETMYQISQHYGIKTEKLYQWNLMNEEKREQPRAGEMISLRKKVRMKPLLRLPGDSFKVEQMQQQEQDEAVQTHDEEEVVVVENEKPLITDEPIVIQQKETASISEPQNVHLLEEEPKEDLWETYPSTQQSPKSVPVQEDQTNEADNQSHGRAIIYDPTPAVNQQPIRTYKAPTAKKTTAPVIKQQPQPQETKTTVTYHKVVKGDTLYGLSRKYGVSVSQIQSWNDLSSSNIKIGQKLIVGK